MHENVLSRRARYAYEFGRLRLGLRVAAVVLAVGGAAVLSCSRQVAGLALATLLALLVGGCEWCGGALRRGARAGLLAGLGPFFVPLASSLFHALQTGAACPPPLAVCLVAGSVGGLTLAMTDRKSWREPRFWAAAVLVVLTCGGAGCLAAGLAGLAAMALGLAAGSAPALTLAVTR